MSVYKLGLAEVLHTIDSVMSQSSHPAFWRIRTLTSRRAATNIHAALDSAHTVVNTAGPLSTSRSVDIPYAPNT